jgi:ATP-dependent DNA ligase
VLPARRLPEHGLVAWDVVKRRGYEGLVAKDEQSSYRPGPSRSWLKLKVRHEGIFTVGGLLGTPEACEGVLVGERVGRRLVYRGFVEWGIGRAMLAELLERCPVARSSPFVDPPRMRRVVWLQPRARIPVTYNELMEDRLRDPVFRGFAGGRVGRGNRDGG